MPVLCLWSFEDLCDRISGVPLSVVAACGWGMFSDANMTVHIQHLGQRLAELARPRKMTLRALDCRAYDITAVRNEALLSSA